MTAIEPTKKRGIDTATFAASEEANVRLWLEKHGSSRNVYFHVNPVRERLTKKAEREDIAALAWIHVDVDPRAGEDLENEQRRIAKLFHENLPPGIPKPTCVVFSGGGYQGFWRLKKPMPLNGDVALCEKAKLYNLQVELAFAADSCHNVDRIMRLPGTINRPDERKIRKGRKPALAKVVEWNEDAVYDLEQFTPAAPVQSKADAGFSGGTAKQAIHVSGNIKRLASVAELGPNVNDYAKVVINVGHDPDNPTKLGSRSDWVWFAVCELVRSKVEDDVIFSVITDPAFGISGHILDQDNPEKSALRQIERAKEYAIDPTLMELNERHAVVEDVGGKCRVISEVADGFANKRTCLTFQSAADFKLRYLNRKVEWQSTNGSKLSMRVGDWWLGHEHRRQYTNIVFAPELEVEGAYNLWKGFAFQAKPGACQRFLDHVFENVCSRDKAHYDYLLGWMATAVQHPARPGHTAVVLRGTQGTGKSFFAKTFGSLFGRHFLQVADSKHLVGSFNAHLRDCVVLFGDEAFYAGDKKHESVLKMLVTEETITIEAKGVDATAAPNYVHIIMASNDEWVVPAGFHERRFFVLDVGTVHRQDNAYFQTIQKELDEGGYEALLYFLRTYDLTGFNVRALPQTKGLTEQKLLSYSGEKDWWYQKLLAGEVLRGVGWPEHVFSIELVQDYTDHVRRFNLSGRGNETKLGMFLRRCVPVGFEPRGQLWGFHEVHIDGKPVRVDRPRVHRLPPLDTCRKIWDANFGGPFDWPQIKEPEKPTTAAVASGEKIPF